jgi:hypothetical protein
MFEFPLTVELSSIFYETLISNDVVTRFTEGVQFDFGANFTILSDPGSVPEPRGTRLVSLCILQF